MKKLVVFILLAAVFSSFSPFASADYALDKPSAGQVIFMQADNDLDYTAAFPLSALTGAFREGEDLRLEFPAARLTLEGFFTRLGEWRSLSFSDGGSLGGADFDEEGRCTKSFHAVLGREKSGSAKSTGIGAQLLTLRLSPYGTEVFVGDEVIWGELRERCIGAFAAVYPFEKPDWNSVLELRCQFLMGEDGSLEPVRFYSDFADGVSSEIINPARVCSASSLQLLPLSEGRAVVSFSNRLGERLLSADVLCRRDESSGLCVEYMCEGCGELQTGAFHYLSCGHYSCAEGFDPAGHDIAPCQVAGHCVSESEHEKCSNCQEYCCDGREHGPGFCEHVHNWVAVTLVSSRCTGCGYVYTRK